MHPDRIKLKVVGVLTCAEFQKCKYYAKRLHHKYPNKFAPPCIRSMLNVQWDDFLIKFKRNVGGKFWQLDNHVAIFKNGVFFGYDVDFYKVCNVKFNIHSFKNFAQLGERNIREIIENSERNYVYFSISINGEMIGTMLFELFTDLAPMACINFLRLVNRVTRGYTKSIVQRVVKHCWVQIGGYNLKRHRMPCENYCIPHDRRGVLSMCHNGKNNDNNTQFIISLDPSEWMDQYYVAFGQVVHGSEVLQKIENVSTYYESPTVPIIVEDCGEYNFSMKPGRKFEKIFENYITLINDQITVIPDGVEESDTLDSIMKYPSDIIDGIDNREVPSTFSILKTLYKIPCCSGIHSPD